MTMAIKKIKLPDNVTVDINDSRLPAVTATDNGKLLGVDGGIWSKVNKPSYTFSEIGSTPTSLGGYGITDWLVKSTTDSLDSLTTAGVYKLSSQATPYGSYGNLFVIHGAGDTLAQMYFPYDADAVFFRRGTTSNFTSNTWKNFYHSGNSNKSDVAWACSQLTANSQVRCAGSVRVYTDNNQNYGYIKEVNTGTNTANLVLGSTYGYNTEVEGLRIYNGKVGVGGVSSPAQALSVSGNIVATGTITPGSDSRIKDNQEDIPSEYAISVIANLKPKTWVWNEKSNENLNGKSAAGLVAQEVKEILPDAVTISEDGDIKDFHSLNYNTIQGYEIAAIKGLIEEVKSLKAEIAELKEQIK